MRLQTKMKKVLVGLLSFSVIFCTTGWSADTGLADSTASNGKLPEQPDFLIYAEVVSAREQISYVLQEGEPDGSLVRSAPPPREGKTPEHTFADLTVGAGCTYGTISSAITAANPGDRLLIEGGVTFSENLEISKNLTLQGGYDGCDSASVDKTTITSSGPGSVITIASSEVALRNLNITGGNHTHGGGLHIYLTAQVTLDNTEVFLNQAQYGAGAYVSLGAKLTLSNASKIRNNTASVSGGGVHILGELVANDWNSYIRDNAASHGGGIFVSGTTEPPGGIVNLSGTHVRGNNANALDGRGGGIYADADSSVSVTGSSNIADNIAQYGGGIFADNASLQMAAVVHSNTAYNFGGGIYIINGSTLTADNTYIGYPSSTYGVNEAQYGAGIYMADSTLNFSGLIVNNLAELNGGGVYALASSLNLTNAQIGGTDPYHANFLSGSGHLGAGLYLAGATQASLVNSLVGGNQIQATTGSTYGGGIYLVGSSTLSLTNSRVEDNTAPSRTDGRGGGLYAYDSTVTLEESEVLSNNAGVHGGGIYCSNCDLEISSGSSVSHNTAIDGHGGGIYSTNSPAIHISRTEIQDNTAGNDGGAIYVINSSIEIDQSIINDNLSIRSGAIYQHDANSVSQVRNSMITNNTSSEGYGAGIHVNAGTFTLTHVTLADNLIGAGFWASASSISQVSNSIAWGNVAGFVGTINSASCNIDQSESIGDDIDPRFISQGLDYRLLPSSPAIDACDSGLDYDLYGVDRPFGLGYDMGAYEWINYSPTGSHEGAQGEVNKTSCSAFGWAVDENDPHREVQIQILAGSIQVASTTASLFREDLESTCPGGNCAFSVDLWGLITPGEEHTISAQAYDEDSGEWVDLPGTPKTLICQMDALYLPFLKK